MSNISPYNLLAYALGLLAAIGFVIIVVQGIQEARRHKRYLQVWQCPKCRYCISGASKEHSQFDYTCPRCNDRKFSQFVRVEGEK